MRLRVIGIGSPHGDDAVGIAVAERLAREPLPAGVEVLARARPGLDLVDDLRGADAVVLVDALHGGGAPGSVRTVDPAALATAGEGSTHGFGVADALALASALGGALPALRIVAIEAETDRGLALSPRVDAAVEVACALVRDELRWLARSR